MKYLSFTLLLLTGLAVSAQQLNTSSFSKLYSMLHNPATVGSSKHAFVGATFKTQWSGMPGSPRTGLVYGQGYLPAAKIGLGGYLYHDVTGPTARTGLQTAYAYHIPLQEESSLSFGIEARLVQLGFDRAKLQAELRGLDPVALNAGNRIKADAGFGLSYTSPLWQIGASVSQLVQSKFNLYEVVGTTSAQSRLYRHWYLHGAYKWKLDEETTLTPNALFIYLPNAPLEIQSGIRFSHHDLFWGGMHWRARQGWMISAGVKLKERLSVGYSFDLYSSPLSIYDNGWPGHELLLHYDFL